MNVQKMPVKEAMSKVENADSIIDELIGHVFTEGQFLNMATKGWSDLSEEDKDEIENILSEPFKKDFVEWVSEKPFVYDGATRLHDMEEQLEKYLETALNRFLEFVWDEYAEEAQTLVDELIGMKESHTRKEKPLNELFNKHYPDDDEIIFIVGPFVYDYKGNRELDGYDTCDAFTDYESAERFAQYNLANKSEDGVYFPIFKVEREEWERDENECLTDDMVVGIVKKNEMLMRNLRYGRDLDYKYMPKTITGKGDYNQRMSYWGHIDESRKPRNGSRMLRESFLGNRQKGGFDAAKVVRNLKDGRYDDETVIAACVSALDKMQKAALAQKLVKQLASDGILAKVYRKSGDFGTKE